MKKIFGLLLIFAFAFSLSLFGAPVRAQAEEENDVEFEVTCTETVDGDLKFIVNVTKNDGINALVLRVEYDEAVLTLRDRTFGSALDEMDPDPTDNYSEKKAPYVVLYTGVESNVSATGKLLTLVFHAKKDVQSASEKVKLVVREVSYVPDGTTRSTYNQKYGAPVDGKENPVQAGGMTVAEVNCAVSAAGKLSVVKVTNDIEEPFVPDSEVDRGSVNVGLIVGLAVGGAAIIAGLVVGGYFLKKRKKGGRSAGDNREKSKRPDDRDGERK